MYTYMYQKDSCVLCAGDGEKEEWYIGIWCWAQIHLNGELQFKGENRDYF